MSQMYVCGIDRDIRAHLWQCTLAYMSRTDPALKRSRRIAVATLPLEALEDREAALQCWCAAGPFRGQTRHRRHDHHDGRHARISFSSVKTDAFGYAPVVVSACQQERTDASQKVLKKSLATFHDKQRLYRRVRTDMSMPISFDEALLCIVDGVWSLRPVPSATSAVECSR